MKFFFIQFLLFVFLHPTNTNGQQLIPTSYHTSDSLFREGDFENAAPLLLVLSTLNTNDSLKAEILMRHGIVLNYQNKTDSAIHFLKIAANIFKIQKNGIKLSRALQNIGDFYTTKKKYEEARMYLNDALANATLAKDSIKIYISIIFISIQKKEYEKAYLISKERLEKYKVGLITDQNYYVYLVKGLHLIKKNKYDSALFFLQKALLNTEVLYYKVAAVNNIAEVYIRLNKFDSALHYQNISSSLNLTNNIAENIQASYNNYTDIYEGLGNFKKALYYSKLGRSLSDSFFDKRQTEALSDAEAKYQNEKTRAEKALVEKDNSIKQRSLIFSFIGLGLVAMLAFVGLRSARLKQKANTLLDVQKTTLQQLANELTVANNTKARLFSTIGHDLRSPISSLYAHIKLNELKGNTGNSEMSTHTTNLLDTLEELLAWSKSQLDGFVLQKVNINMYVLFDELKSFYSVAAAAANVTLANNTTDNIIIKTDENILKTILRNLISNAIAHTPKNGKIFFNAYNVNGVDTFSITNTCSKESFDILKINYTKADIKSDTHGFGIVLINEFAQKINAKMQLNYSDECANIIFNITSTEPTKCT